MKNFLSIPSIKSRLMFSLPGLAILFFYPFTGVRALDAIHLDLDMLETELFKIQQLYLTLEWTSESTLALAAGAGLITSSALEAPVSIRIRCPTADFADNRITCGAGVLELINNLQEVARVSIRFDLDTGKEQNWQISTEQIRFTMAPWFSLLQPVSAVLAGYEPGGGSIMARFRLGGRGGSLDSMEMEAQLDEVSINGPNVVEALSAKLDLSMHHSAEVWSISGKLQLQDGAMYLLAPVPVFNDKPGFFIEIGDEPLVLEIQALWNATADQLSIEHFNYVHPGLLALQGSATGSLAGRQSLTDFALSAGIPDLEAAFPVYLQPFLLPTSFNDLQVAGGLQADIANREGVLQQAGLVFDDVYVNDAHHRFGIYGLRGELVVSSDEVSRRSILDWDSMSFYRLDIGSGNIVLQSQGGDVDVLEWKNLEVLDGVFRINNFSMRNFGKPDFSITIDGNLSPVSLQAFTLAMQWPLMKGSLSGSFSGLRYHHNLLELNDDIRIQAFDGEVILRNLVISDIFSQYSVLNTDIEMNGLDLEQLTQTFSFGKIEGSMSGTVTDLVLEDWRPVSFNAHFATIDDGKPHRISQKALENLNELGGGLGGTMSQGFLKIFPEYSYGQIGISCRLQNNICSLGGIRDVEGGSWLLTRGGLLPPWVEIRALGRSIRWDELIDGLIQISSGGVEIR